MAAVKMSVAASGAVSDNNLEAVTKWRPSK
jgi:hypothetical protein